MNEPDDQPRMRLDELPDLVLEGILKCLTYDEISKFRRVNRKLNIICKSLLNKGFRNVEKYNLKCLKEFKAKLPRRESERRDHPLARHCDILVAIETRISLLTMTFMNYVDLGLCCFIPGKVIDEIYSVLRIIKKGGRLDSSCEVLQEFRDITTMAMEYFEKKIVPSLQTKIPGLSPVRLNNGSYFSSIFTSGTGFSLRYDTLKPPASPLCKLSSVSTPASEPNPRQRASTSRGLQTPLSSKKPSLKASRLVRDLKRQADTYKASVESQNKKMLELDRRIDQQNELIGQQNARLAEQEEKLAEMSRRLAENTSHFTDLTSHQIRPFKSDGAVASSSNDGAASPAASVATVAVVGGSNGSGAKNLMAAPLVTEKTGFHRDNSACLSRPRKRGRSQENEEKAAVTKRTKK